MSKSGLAEAAARFLEAESRHDAERKHRRTAKRTPRRGKPAALQTQPVEQLAVDRLEAVVPEQFEDLEWPAAPFVPSVEAAVVVVRAPDIQELAKKEDHAVVCPDCDLPIEPHTDQCPHCALFLPRAA